MEKLASKETSTSCGIENERLVNDSIIPIFEKLEASTSCGIENERLVNDSIVPIFEKLEPLVSTECRIYKVPYYLRKLNEEAYTPQVISIGPIHHDKERFQTMEKHKVRYFNSFIQQYKINRKDLVSTIRGMEDSIRCCYVETIQLKGDDFVNMIMLDASFILDLFLKCHGGEWTGDDPMKVEAWLFGNVLRELLLLENQLPFFVIKKLYRLALPFHSNSISLIHLTFHFFKHLNIHNKSPSNVEIQHFTDLLRFFRLPPLLPTRVDLEPEVSFPKYSVTQLHEAGVKFKVISSINEEGKTVRSKCLQDLKFKKGVLEIPLLEFDDTTEAFVRNIMALEQCDDRSHPYITDFYLILDCLINTTADVDLLSDKGILVNCLGDSNAVKSMINDLNKGIMWRKFNINFKQLGEDLNEYYEEPWHRWKATLRHEYCSTPWRLASTIAASILLLLTLIQTVFSILQVFLKPK